MPERLHLAVRAQLDAGIASQKAFDRDIDKARSEFPFNRPSNDPIVWILTLLNAKAELVPRTSERNFPALAEVVPRAQAFIRLLAEMAGIYDAIPVGGHSAPGGWSERDYAAAEKRLATAASHWLELNSGILAFKAALHPAIVAFMRLLVSMTRPALPGQPITDGLDASPDPAAVSRLFLIAMERQPGTGPTPV
jgi:hypothetical protein